MYSFTAICFLVGCATLTFAQPPFDHCSCNKNVLSCRRPLPTYYSYSHRARGNRTRFSRESPNITPYIDVEGICPNATEVLIGGLDLEEYPDGINGRVTKIVASSNNIKSLPNAGQLSNIIKYLDLSANQIKNADEEEDLRLLGALEELHLSWNRLKHLRFLPNPCALRHLSIKVNYISNLEESLGNCTHLEYFGIRANNVTFLPDEGFMGLTKLRDLVLSSNPIETLSNRSFVGLISLENLEISETLLSTLPNKAFAGLKKLKQLTLSRNPFVNLPPRVFEGLTELVLLDLSYALKNATVPEETFSGLSNLQELNLAYNNLVSFPTNLFSGLGNLRKLYLDHNDLSTFHQDSFQDLRNLEVLHLQRNELEYIPIGVFSSLENLRVLFLGDNQLRVLPGSLFANTRALEELNVYNNYLTALPELRACCESLRVISFGNNSVSAPTEVALRALLDAGAERRVDLKKNPIRASSLRWVLRAQDVTTYDAYCTCGELRKGDARVEFCIDAPCIREPGFNSWVAYVRAVNAD